MRHRGHNEPEGQMLSVSCHMTCGTEGILSLKIRRYVAQRHLNLKIRRYVHVVNR